MTPPRFDYVAPRSLQEAIDLLRTRGEGAKILAGGQSLVPIMKLRLASPTLLIDIRKIQGLERIKESNGSLTLGARVRVAELARSELIRRRYATLHDASLTIADPLIRNLGTVGGNIAHGDPANDLPAVTLALRGSLVATGPQGSRTISAEDFYLDAFATALAHDEILTQVRVPSPPPRSGGVYLKVKRKVGDFATAAVAVQLSLGRRSECTRVGIGLTAAGPTPVKAKRAEEAMLGKKPTDRKAVGEAASLAAEASSPSSDIRGTADYKKSLIRLLVVRGLKRAYERARGEG